MTNIELEKRVALLDRHLYDLICILQGTKGPFDTPKEALKWLRLEVEKHDKT